MHESIIFSTSCTSSYTSQLLGNHWITVNNYKVFCEPKIGYEGKIREDKIDS